MLITYNIFRTLSLDAVHSNNSFNAVFVLVQGSTINETFNQPEQPILRTKRLDYPAPNNHYENFLVACLTAEMVVIRKC